MDPKIFFGELKRRNVYKVGAAYAVVAWLLMQIASKRTVTDRRPTLRSKILSQRIRRAASFRSRSFTLSARSPTRCSNGLMRPMPRAIPGWFSWPLHLLFSLLGRPAFHRVVSKAQRAVAFKAWDVMSEPSFFAELKRRNVYKAAVAYAVVAWLREEWDKAFEWLQIAFDNHDGGMPSPLVDPVLRSLHENARYKNLVVKVGLPTTP